MSAPTICLAMIVRDEAPVIARCLESVKPFITYWTICDTGSVDETCEIVRLTMAGIPGKLYHHRWKDFGHNKTMALDVARSSGCEYVLMIDADETLVTSGPDVFADLTADAYRLEMWFPTIHYPRLNLMRSTHRWRYVGTIHEYPTCDPQVEEVLLDPAKAHMWTDGQGARGRSGTKTERDILVLEQSTHDEPDNPRYWFYLAQAYESIGRVEEARRTYATRAQMGDYVEEMWYSHYHLGHLAYAAGEWPTAVAHYLDAYACLPSRVEPLFWLAVGYQNRGHHATAMLFVRQAITIDKPITALFLEPHIYDCLRWVQYAIGLYHTGQRDEARDMARRVLTDSVVPEENIPMMRQIAALDAAQSEPPVAADPPGLVRLNLGCGDTPLAGWTNVDLFDAPGVQVADLTQRWPWADSSVDAARAWHLFEHLPNRVHTMNELWRVLKPGAIAEIQVPTVDGPAAFSSPTHVSYWHRQTFLHFEDGLIHRERWGARDGITARFRTLDEHVDTLPDTVNLTMWLQAVK